MSNKKMSPERLQEIIKGERSAVETYKQVFEKYGTDPQLDELRHYSAQHKHAVEYFTNLAKKEEVEVPTTSGVWGTWAKLFTGTAKTIGKETALKALKEGEEHGKLQYQDIVENDYSLDSDLKNKFKNEFIKNQENHITGINQVISRLI